MKKAHPYIQRDLVNTEPWRPLLKTHITLAFMFTSRSSFCMPYAYIYGNIRHIASHTFKVVVKTNFFHESFSQSRSHFTIKSRDASLFFVSRHKVRKPSHGVKSVHVTSLCLASVVSLNMSQHLHNFGPSNYNNDTSSFFYDLVIELMPKMSKPDAPKHATNIFNITDEKGNT